MDHNTKFHQFRTVVASIFAYSDNGKILIDFIKYAVKISIAAELYDTKYKLDVQNCVRLCRFFQKTSKSSV